MARFAAKLCLAESTLARGLATKVYAALAKCQSMRGAIAAKSRKRSSVASEATIDIAGRHTLNQDMNQSRKSRSGSGCLIVETSADALTTAESISASSSVIHKRRLFHTALGHRTLSLIAHVGRQSLKRSQKALGLPVQILFLLATNPA